MNLGPQTEAKIHYANFLEWTSQSSEFYQFKQLQGELKLQHFLSNPKEIESICREQWQNTPILDMESLTLNPRRLEV